MPVRRVSTPRETFDHVRSFDLCHCPVFSLAILADREPSWRPDQFGYELWRRKLDLNYPVVKLVDYLDRLVELETTVN